MGTFFNLPGNIRSSFNLCQGDTGIDGFFIQVLKAGDTVRRCGGADCD
jgi:hypothetical protein